MASSPADTSARAAAARARIDHVWTLFAFTWAAAVLFHLAGNPRLAPNWGRAFLGLAALAVLTRPRDPRVAAPLAVAVLANVWLEAPILGNHWLLHGFIAVVVLAAVAVAREDAGLAISRLLGPVRLILLIFYSFAAFAKLNTDFFDPVVSCAVFYLRESADSWGALGLVDWLPRGGEQAVAVAVAAIELSVPVLLVRRRTREFAVVYAMAFHFVLAIDRTHQFADFSSLLAACFLLFLSPATSAAVTDELRGFVDRLRGPLRSGPELLRVAGLAAVGLVVLVASGPDDWPAPDVLRELAVTIWLAYGAFLIVVVQRARRRSGVEPEELPPLLPAGTPRVLLVVPVLVFVNGLLPYLEVKTANGFNMYANLALVDGESNHLLIRRSLPVTDVHERLVEIVDHEDAGLDFYVDSPWLLPERTLFDHLAGRTDAVVEGRVDGETVVYTGAAAEARPVWQQKFQLFRAVDTSGAVACQPSFGPAR